MTITHVQISTAVAFIVGYFAAHAAGLLTKLNAPRWVLGAVTVGLSTLAGVLATVVWNDGDTWQTYLANVATALVATTLAHKSQIPQALQAATARFGIGRPTPAPPAS